MSLSDEDEDGPTMKDQDKTKEQLIEELTRLRQHLADQRRTDDNLPVLVAKAGLDGYYQWVNAAFERILGWSEKESLTRLFLEFIHPDDRAAAIEAFERLKAGEAAINFVDRNLCKDGSHRWVNWNVIPLPDREIVFGIGEDITERKLAEEMLKKAHEELEEKVQDRTAELTAAHEALRQSNDELQAIYDGMSDGILIADTETQQFVQANASICRMLGYSKEEFLTKSVRDIHPIESTPAVLEAFRMVIEGRRHGSVEMPVLRKDGSTFVAEISENRAIYNGRPCLIGFFRDITGRNEAQEALERERQSLWNMLQASDHERQTIAYDIHDGLAQYLAAADMQFQVHDSLKGKSPHHARKAYETAVQLVRQAHAESRRLISEVRHPVIDERGLETAITSLAYEQRQRGGPRIECHTSVEFDRLPPILENALYRMAQEALTNACKHSKSKKVTVKLIQEGQEVLLEVRDEGRGFDTETAGEDRFGLESIRQRVRLLGGRLSIESRSGNGTLVRAVVPIVERQEDAPKRFGPPTSSRRPSGPCAGR